MTLLCRIARMRNLLVLSLFATASSLGPTASAQVTLYTQPGETPGQGLGSVAWADDLDGDGIDDFVSLHPDDDATGQAAGAVVARRGVDGSILFRVEPGAAGDRFGTSAASIGDVDEDGIPDLAIGAPGVPGQGLPGYVSIVSGADGSELLRIVGTEIDGRFGHAVAGLGDVDGDGRGDVLIGAPGEDGAGSDRGAAYVASGSSGEILHAAGGDDDGDEYGISVSGSGPVMGDLDPIPLIGATTQNASSQGTGYLHVRSRTDFALIRTHTGDVAGDQLGYVVQPAGDLDGDGVPDYAAAADPRTVGGLPAGPGYVRAWSGTDGALLLSVVGTETGTGFGSTLAALGDVDLDGFDDLAVGSPNSSTYGVGDGRLKIYSGATSNLIHDLVGEYGSNAAFGSGLVLLGDVDGDALPDFVTTEARADANGTDSGRMIALSLTPWNNVADGVPGENGVPILKAQGSMAPGTDISLELTNTPAFTTVALTIGYALAFDSSTGTFTPTPDIVEPGLVTDTVGSVTHEFTWPQEAPQGFTAYFQYRVTDGSASGGESRSNTVEGETAGS